MVEVKKVEFNGWKNCLSLSNKTVEVIVTTDIGPRIISYNVLNKGNHLKVFEKTAGKTGGDKFNLYGGHRVWHAPEEKERTYFPDNTACVYEIKGNTVSVMHKEPQTNLSRGVVVEMLENGSLIVNNIISNDGFFDVELSVWGITQFAHGGLMAVPNSNLDTGLMANRAVSLWPYSKMNDKRIYWGDKFITVLPDSKNAQPFKFGASADEGYAAYFNHGQLVVIEFEHYFNAEYPNFYCNFESYVNDEFVELETLSPLMTLEPGEVTVSVEKWHVADGVKKPDAADEKNIEKEINALLKKVKKD